MKVVIKPSWLRACGKEYLEGKELPVVQRTDFINVGSGFEKFYTVDVDNHFWIVACCRVEKLIQ